MLSQTVEYALRAVALLSDAAPEPRTTDQIASATRVPKAYLSKVLQGLTKAGLVRSLRGKQGGFALDCDPNELTILQVVNSVDPIQRIRSCPLKIESHGKTLCPLHRRLDEAIATVEEAFASTTLGEILAEPSPSVPLCDVNSDDNEQIVKLETP